VCFLHGLRVSELIDLRRAGAIRIRRLKGSHDGVHMLERDEASGLRRLRESKTQSALTSSRQSAVKLLQGSPSTR
jgi:hypothetical protein